MILRGDRHVIVSVSVNRGYWTGGHYPEAWTPVSVFKRYDPEPKGSGVEPHYHDGDEFWLFAEANEHLLVLAGDVELTVDGVTVTLARGDAAFLRGGASRRVASPEGARVALARE